MEANERTEQAVLETVLLIPHRFKRAIRRTELRQIVPLADTTIYEMEQRGDFPRRFYLTSRCVVLSNGELALLALLRLRGGASLRYLFPRRETLVASFRQRNTIRAVLADRQRLAAAETG